MTYESSKGSILIVDDTPANLSVLLEILEGNHYEIRVAEEGERALEQVGYAQPDIILLDVVMPGMDGFETCRRLKENELTRDIPVIFMSARSGTTDKVKGFELGAVDYITKPLQHEEVQARVTTHLTIRNLQRELQQTNRELEERMVALQRLHSEVEERRREVSEKNIELEKTLLQLRETQNQLIIKEKMASLGHLVAGISHELNSPVGAINSMHNTLIRAIDKLKDALNQAFSQEYEDNRTIQSSFQVMVDANRVMATGAERVTRIVRSLRNFARLDEAEFQVANLHEGIESTLTLLHSQMEDEITVIKDFGDIKPIFCSPSQLNQVFMHLLRNAIQSIEGEGEIGIKTFEDNNEVYVQISDTGKGIPSEQLERIFDVGFSATDSRVEMEFGLSTDYHIIQEHHGEIKVKSEVGKGTEVTICLPMRDSDVR